MSVLRRYARFLPLLTTIVLAVPAPAQKSPDAETSDLQKATQNPVASLISVPLQNNSNFGIGPEDRTQTVLNIQPVIPIRISENWNLIIRWITPVVSQPVPTVEDLGYFGKFGLGPSLMILVQPGHWNAVYPKESSPWSMRLQIAFLFPKKARWNPVEMERPTHGV